MASSVRASVQSPSEKPENKGQKQEGLFKNGFLPYLQEGLFSDLVLLHNDNRYNVHQIILVHSSDYFALNLRSRNTEDQKLNKSDIEVFVDSESGISKRLLRLVMSDPTNAFGSVLQYMYAGTISITDDNAIPLLAIADFLKIEDLQKRINEYLSTNITRTTVLQILKSALEIKTEDIIEKCILVLARNFSQMYAAGANLNFLPIEIMLSLLRHDSLAVSSEYSVYKTICNYLSANYPDKPESDIPLSVRMSLFENVRFPFLLYEELEEAMKEPLIPTQLLAEALMVRLAKYEYPEKASSAVIRLQKRAAYGRLFEYVYDFDDKGVLYWIGTKGGTAKWRNPCLVENGVKITSSSVEKGDPISIVGRKPVECWTCDVPASWFCVDLGPTRTLILTYYTLRHGGNSKQDSLRNWTLQGSDDGKTWTVLNRHRDEEVLNATFQAYSWQVTTCTKPYRFFRVLQTGHNASNHNFLSLSGVEFYGELYDSNPS